MIQVVLFDADGVVIKDHDYFSARYKRDFGSSLDDETITSFFKNDYKNTAIGKADLKELLKTSLSKWGWNGSVDELLNYWFEGERELDGRVLSAVNEIRKSGKKCYLASDNEKYRATYLLNEVGLKNHFDDAYFSCHIGYTKSDPEFFKFILNELKLNPEEVMYFDDDPKNIEVARSVGIKASHYESFEDLEKELNNNFNI